MRGASLLVKGGRLLDPATGRDEKGDLLIVDGQIEEIGGDLQAPEGVQVLDASEGSRVVCPGFVDIHVHFREPGQEYKETIATGARAAVAGGFTAVCTMPNTDPVTDEASVVEFQKARAREADACRVYPIGAVSKGQKGEILAEMGEMHRAGAVAFSDDGYPIWNTALMRRALEYAEGLDVPIIQHAEDRWIKADGVMNEGAVSSRLGLPGIHPVGEAVCVARDLLLVELTGARYHVAHLSAGRALDLVRVARERGLPVSCEVTPHHLLLTDEVCREFDANTKMNPPLRASEDVEALVEGLAEGSIDCIATDHAPHVPTEKEQEFTCAPFGVIGLETAVPLLLDRLVRPGRVSLERLVDAFTAAPCRLLDLPGGRLEKGSPGDLTVLDLERETTVDPAQMLSRSRNTPFAGWTLRGGPVATVVAGGVKWGV